MKKFTKILKNQKGLTLIELLAVIVILAIVAAIAVPAIGNVIDNSRDKAILADASSVLSAAKLAALDGACEETTNSTTKVKTITCEDTDLTKYVEGVTLVAADQVVKVGNVWTVTYSKLADIKNISKFTVAVAGNVVTGYTPPATAITENALNKAMNQ
ncbi:type II secretion system protein [Psychrobacillus sp. FSL H8-0484]|uniref:type II secretion system protein n=1 Tax=Psychrobacillus sp. FSL H8-0484 TaxID=2921390 RepID=UPI0030F591A2